MGVTAPAAAQSAKVGPVVDLLKFVHDWEISKQFTIDVAKAMPADLYTFKPNPGEMTFGEQMVQVAMSNAFRFQPDYWHQAPVSAGSLEAARFRQGVSA